MIIKSLIFVLLLEAASFGIPKIWKDGNSLNANLDNSSRETHSGLRRRTIEEVFGKRSKPDVSGKHLPALPNNDRLVLRGRNKRELPDPGVKHHASLAAHPRKRRFQHYDELDAIMNRLAAFNIKRRIPPADTSVGVKVAGKVNINVVQQESKEGSQKGIQQDDHQSVSVHVIGSMLDQSEPEKNIQEIHSSLQHAKEQARYFIDASGVNTPQESSQVKISVELQNKPGKPDVISVEHVSNAEPELTPIKDLEQIPDYELEPDTGDEQPSSSTIEHTQIPGAESVVLVTKLLKQTNLKVPVDLEEDVEETDGDETIENEVENIEDEDDEELEIVESKQNVEKKVTKRPSEEQKPTEIEANGKEASKNDGTVTEETSDDDACDDEDENTVEENIEDDHDTETEDVSSDAEDEDADCDDEDSVDEGENKNAGGETNENENEKTISKNLDKTTVDGQISSKSNDEKPGKASEDTTTIKSSVGGETISKNKIESTPVEEEEDCED